MARLSAVWERAAIRDPYFAVLSDPARKGGGWSQPEFFQTGADEIATVLTYLDGIGVDVPREGPALDFGCGLGRLTVPLAERFGHAVGIDVSETMVSAASGLHSSAANVRFLENHRDDLALFPDDHFTFVYSNIVLQHMPKVLAKRYVEEFVRVTGPAGMIMFQLPDRYREGIAGRMRTMIRLRTRLRSLLGRPPGDRDVVEWEMHGTPEAEVRAWLEGVHARVRDVALTNAAEPTFNGKLRYLANPPLRGWVSKQYLVLVQ